MYDAAPAKPAPNAADTPEDKVRLDRLRQMSQSSVVGGDVLWLLGERDYWRRVYMDCEFELDRLRAAPAEPASIPAPASEIEHLREIEHVLWHALDESNEQPDGSVIIASYDARKLCTLLPEGHPEVEDMPIPAPEPDIAKWIGPDGLLPDGTRPAADPPADDLTRRIDSFIVSTAPTAARLLVNDLAARIAALELQVEDLLQELKESKQSMGEM